MAQVPTGTITSVPGITLVPSRPTDLEFLCCVYASTRIEEMSLVAEWTAEQKDAFLRWQFQAQHQHYQTHYPHATYDLIVKDEVPVGRLYVASGVREIRIMDIALLPAYRNNGIGSGLVRGILAQAEKSGRLVSLHVEEENPAKRLYERLGFVVVGETGIYKLLHWVPSNGESAANAGI